MEFDFTTILDRVGKDAIAVERIPFAGAEVKEGFSLNEEELRDFCLELPRYKRPHRIIFADVPRNPTGKIEKPRLREIYCGKSVVAMENEI